MSTLREAAQQALEAMDVFANAIRVWPEETWAPHEFAAMDKGEAALDALRAALAQQTQTPCDIAEDGVCEVIDCCRKSPLILEALEIGYESARVEAAQYHAAMAGYRPERHAAMDADVAKIAAAITALRDALAQQDQEPVVFTVTKSGALLEWEPTVGAFALPDGKHSLYTHPPRREWRGLTMQEINDGRDQLPTEDLCGWSFRQGAYFAETRLKEKNA